MNKKGFNNNPILFILIIFICISIIDIGMNQNLLNAQQDEFNKNLELRHQRIFLVYQDNWLNTEKQHKSCPISYND